MNLHVGQNVGARQSARGDGHGLHMATPATPANIDSLRGYISVVRVDLVGGWDVGFGDPSTDPPKIVFSCVSKIIQILSSPTLIPADSLLFANTAEFVGWAR